MKRIFSILFGLTLVLALAMVPIQTALADYATFDNPNYYYCQITNAPSGTYYRSAGLSPDGTKIVAQKQVGTSREVVLMNADGTGETIISPGDSGTGDIYGYMNLFWSDDGTAIGFLEVHNANPNKVIVYDISSSTQSYIYQPAAPNDVNNPDFLGSSKTSIIFWAYGPVGGADLFTWDGTTLTNITNTANYKEYEPVSNADGTKIVYWSGETPAEPVSTTHTLSYSGGTWTQDVGFTPIPGTYWAYWTTPAATQIALSVMSQPDYTLAGYATGTLDIYIYDSAGNFVTDLTGPGYTGGSGQWNFFGNMPQPSTGGQFVITSNAGRGATPGRDIIMVSPRTVSVGTYTGGTAYFSPDDGSIVSLIAVPPPATPPVTLPYGMFEFKICCMTGSTATLSVTLPGPVPVGTRWYKYHAGSWDSLPIGSDDGDSFITVTLTDGASPDDEDLIPGQITDQGGPGNPGAVGWETYPINKVRVLLPWIALFAAIVAGAGLLVLRRRRAQS
jgi:hypothetical protein